MRKGWSARRRNELRRTSDRVEALVTFVLVMTGLMAGPLITWWVALQAYEEDQRAGAWDRQHRFAVVAVLLEDAASASAAATDAPEAPTVPARITWAGPDGVPRTGILPVAAGLGAGSGVPIWVDEHGAVVAPPVRRNPVMRAVVVAMLIAGGVTVAIARVHRVVVRLLDRRRLRAWQAEWLAVEPGWSHR